MRLNPKVGLDSLAEEIPRPQQPGCAMATGHCCEPGPQWEGVELCSKACRLVRKGVETGVQKWLRRTRALIVEDIGAIKEPTCCATPGKVLEGKSQSIILSRVQKRRLA